jgi:hypothetical protein
MQEGKTELIDKQVMEYIEREWLYEKRRPGIVKGAVIDAFFELSLKDDIREIGS